MRMHGMCLLNMNDARSGGVGGFLNNQTDCHSCQAAPTAPAPGVTAHSDSMVCNLTLIQGGHSTALPGHHTVSDVGHACGSQIAFLPIRISPDRGIEPLVIGNSGSDFANLQLTSATSTAPLFSVRGGHCPCCPFHSYDSGFSDAVCDSCANGTSADQSKAPTPLLQQQQQQQNNNHRLQKQLQGCNAFLTVPDSGHCIDTLAGGPFLCGRCHGLCSVTSHCHQRSLPCSCRNSALSNSSHRGFNAPTSQQNKHIPRVVLKSSVDSNKPSIQLVDDGSKAGQTADSLLRPELLHSRSLQDNDIGRHQERCQMAGGHLMEGLPSYRHSTGNAYENVELQNDENMLRERAVRGNSWGSIVRCNSSGSRSGQPGCSSQLAEPMSPIFSPGLGSSSETSDSNNKGQDSSSSNPLQDMDSTMASWPDELSDLTGRPSSPSSSGSSEDSSGSSVASWAQNFTGAAENEAHWKTLKASTKRLSKCGFYYEHMSMEQAKMRLREMPVGTFLLRDSSHKRYLYSLSAKTTRGVTSVRIEYRNSQFRLDCDEKSQSQTPGFDCVLKLIQYYVELTESKRKNKCVWLESSGRKDTPVILIKPALQGVQSLSHLCRKVIHKHVDMQRLAQHLKTDFTNLQYLREYPFDM